MLTPQDLINHANFSIKNSMNNISKLPQNILDINGFSGTKTRHLYNNICSIDGISYLQVGVFEASSPVSAMYGNNITATLIENEGKTHLVKDINMYVNNKYTFINKHFMNVDVSTIPKADVFIYDGKTFLSEAKNAITHYYNALNKYAIIIVDDWNWVKVREGVESSFKKLKTKILFRYAVFTEEPHYLVGKDNYWNGFSIFVIEK